TTPTFISDPATLAAGASRAYLDHSVSSAGMPVGSANAVVWVQFYADHVKLPDLNVVTDIKVGEVKIIGGGGALSLVVWSDIP
ncbi:MAG: hypothetical protein Q8O40_15280, partial [Chloroflexota bacterium]|nr:hypothetical protein [Chloroflexota bacterium]